MKQVIWTQKSCVLCNIIDLQMVITLNKRTSKMKSKITNRQVVFMADGTGEHPGPTYFRDFALMSFGTLMLLLIPCVWNAHLFHFLAWLSPPFKYYFAGPDKKVHWKIAARENICSLIFKNTCEGAMAKIYYAWFTFLHVKFSGTRNFSTLSKLSEKLLEATLYFKYTRHKTHKTLLISLVRYPYCQTIFN